MAEHTTAALDVALAYHRSWTSRDFDRAMTYIAEDIVCQTPAGRLDGAAGSTTCERSSTACRSTPHAEPQEAGNRPVTSDVTERRLRRRAAQQLFDELAVDYLEVPGVSRATMFGSDGLRVDTGFFAFVGRDGQLMPVSSASAISGVASTGSTGSTIRGRSTCRSRAVRWSRISPSTMATGLRGRWSTWRRPAFASCTRNCTRRTTRT
jgi:hypothetical protein